MKPIVKLILLSALVVALPAAAETKDAPAKAPAVETTPKLTGVTCQSYDARTFRPEGVTKTFFTDHAKLRVVFEAATVPPAGQRLRLSLVAKSGRTIRLRPDLTTNGKGRRWSSAVPLAGQAWARNGGEWEFRVHWNDEKEPALRLPFTIETGKRWALLVGIADYPPAGPGGADLPAPDKDAERMRDLLVDTFGFRPERITVVKNLEATTARIVRELEALTTKAGPRDAVLFYYVGHGTQVPDLDGDEPDGWDEALATADPKPPVVSTREQLSLYLSDDRLAEILNRFRTRNVTVIFDCCHSGTAVRAGEDEPEGDGFFTGYRERPGFGRKLVQAAEDAPRRTTPAPTHAVDLDERYVFLSASRSWETSMGGPAGSIFSVVLRDFLRTSNGESWDRLVRRLTPTVQRLNPGQCPQVLGAGRRYPFSLAEAAEDAPFVRPTVAVVGAFDPKDPSQMLPVGETGRHRAFVSGMQSLFAEQAGVAYAVYPASDLNLSGSPRGRVVLTGKLEVIRRSGLPPLYYASAEIASGSVRRGDRLVPLATRLPDARPAVGVFLGRESAPTLQRLRQTVRTILSQLKNESSLQLRNGRPHEMDYVILPKLQNGKTVALVFTPAHSLVGLCSGTDADIAGQIREMVVGRHARFGRVIRLHNPSPSFGLRVVLRGGEGRRRAGEKLRFEGFVDRPAYLYAIAALEGGAAQLVASSSRPLHPGSPFSFQVPLRKDLKGRIAVKVFASTKPLDANRLKTTPAENRGGALVAEMRKAYPGPGGADFLATDGWAEETLWVDFR
jgi:hypothetical protein